MLLYRGLPGKPPLVSKPWLQAAISSAAKKAGYHGWWLADDLATGISTYLRHDYRGSMTSRSHLEAVIRRALCGVGYEEVAVFFRVKIPSVRISLARIVSDAPQNDLTAFFDMLAETIRSLQNADVAHIHFSELQVCVDNLSDSSKTFGLEKDGCLRLAVVAFVREKMESFFCQGQMWCSVT